LASTTAQNGGQVRDRHNEIIPYSVEDRCSVDHVVTKQSPGPGGKLQYRIKHPTEPHERIARETELSEAGDLSMP
jgi:hypothetical protein